MFQTIYVISTQQKANKNVYNIGIQTGDINTTITQFLAYDLSPVIYYLCYVNLKLDLKSEIMKHFHKNLIKKLNNLTWIEVPLDEIIKFLDSLLINVERRVLVDVQKNINHLI